jgi:predicted Zn-dependent protease
VRHSHFSRAYPLILSALLGTAAAKAQTGSSLHSRLLDRRGSTETGNTALGEHSALPGARNSVSIDVLHHPISDKARRMLRQAMETLNSGDAEGAREQLLELLAKESKTAPYVHSVLGVIYTRTSRLGDAVNSFEQASSLLPHDAMNHYNFSVALARTRSYDRAEQEARRALELDPKSESARILLTVLLNRRQARN